MVAQSPQIVGIVGGSCAGKSWLAARLEKAFAGAAARISLDNFYLDRSHLSPGRRARLNFDHPRSIDWQRLEEALQAFSMGNAVSVPRYDFATHGRLSGEMVIGSAALVLIEGLWLFRRPGIRKHLGLKIFIRASDELCRERRLERDTRERGRTAEQVQEQLQRFTAPMFRRFVAPQERYADVVLSAPVTEEDVELLTNRIREKVLIRTGI